MKCPRCQSAEIKVLDTRSKGDVITRRRECDKCHLRFNTNELLDRGDFIELDVWKREGYIEPFSSRKLKEGIKLACAQTTSEISETELEYLLNEIKGDIFSTFSEENKRNRGRNTVSSEQIGMRVIQSLLKNDRIGAAIRFATIFFEFRQPEIMKAISQVIREIIEEKLSSINPKKLEGGIKEKMAHVGK